MNRPNLWVNKETNRQSGSPVHCPFLKFGMRWDMVGTVVLCGWWERGSWGRGERPAAYVYASNILQSREVVYQYKLARKVTVNLTIYLHVLSQNAWCRFVVAWAERGRHPSVQRLILRGWKPMLDVGRGLWRTFLREFVSERWPLWCL